MTGRVSGGDEAALDEALRTQDRIAGAALHGYETQPLTAAAAAKFDGLNNIVLTPRIAGVTEESNIRVSRLIAARPTGKLSGNT